VNADYSAESPDEGVCFVSLLPDEEKGKKAFVYNVKNVPSIF
jgi:hypothetical protein